MIKNNSSQESHKHCCPIENLPSATWFNMSLKKLNSWKNNSTCSSLTGTMYSKSFYKTHIDKKIDI